MRINHRLLCLFTSVFLVAPASAEVIFSFENQGIVLPAASCPPPPALPLGCDLTALGTATSTSDPTLAPWDFLSVFQIGAPLSMTTFATAGTFSFDDTSAANNDFFGFLTGVFDAATFQATISYTVTGGTGLFSSGHGLGNWICIDLSVPERAADLCRTGSIPHSGARLDRVARTGSARAGTHTSGEALISRWEESNAPNASARSAFG